MERLEEYCISVQRIAGVKTYIIHPNFIGAFLNDEELLAALYTSPAAILHWVEEAKEQPTIIFLAFVHHAYARSEKYAWEPVNCYWDGDTYYHVHSRSTWMCRECRHLHHGKFIMPVIEHDATFYHGTNEKYPAIPSIFQAMRCERCGKTLQNHFLFFSLIIGE